jgi:hypothetical protein
MIPNLNGRLVPSAFIFTALAQTDVMTAGELMLRLADASVDIVGRIELHTKIKCHCY